MLFHVRHALHYAYERPVFLEPMTLRLTPRQDGTQRLLRHSLRVTAVPSGSSRVLEPDGNDGQVLWFDDLRDTLTIEVDMVVQTLRENPFDWIVTHAPAGRLPADYPAGEAASLAPALGTAAAIADPVRIWAQDLAAAVDHSSTDFLMHLADTIHHGFHHVGRPDGDPQTPEETLAGRTGACRDTAMLYVDACRSQGLAARFVSGYSMHHPPEVSEHELHAWAEVYLPGGGWRAYDPSLGLAVADGHVVLAAAPDHRLAAPVSGRYRGTGVESHMNYTVALRTAESEQELNVMDLDQPISLPPRERWLDGEIQS
jgi:transglutaminase-like putative cysteine protease